MRLALVLALAAAACGAPASPSTAPQATSLLGKPLHAPPLSADAKARHEAKLAEARAHYDANPDDADAIIWLGRRTAYLGRYRDAIDIFGRGIAKHPTDARLYRHRGHRYITVRQFDRAIADLQRAADLRDGQPDQVEPDGLPNAQGIPVSTLHTNIYYHLGLAHYLRGELDQAIEAYRACMDASKNDDMVVATAYWLYLTLQRAGDSAAAGALLDNIGADMKLIENASYHQLLLLYKGDNTAAHVANGAGADQLANATTGYGIAQWHALAGRTQKAQRALEQVTASPQWSAFGYIAAEADLAAAPAAPPQARR